MFLVLACMCTRVHVDSSGHLVSVCLIPDDGSANIMCVCVGGEEEGEGEIESGSFSVMYR